MRTLPAILASAAAIVVCVAAPVRAGATATASVTVSVDVASRTSLRVSTDVLQFDGAGTGAPVTAAVEFSAGARVPRGGDVMLTVEPQRSMADGAAGVEPSITFEGEGDGTVAGVLSGTPVVAGRWQGSGLRHGRVRFTLHADSVGSYVVPVRFVLSTP